MEILVQGYGEKSFKPDEIEIRFEFSTKSKDYNSTLMSGTKNVEDYFKLLRSLGFSKESIKTNNLRVSEDRVYNEKSRKYEKVGFVYRQNVKLKFDFDIKKMSAIMDKTSKLTNPPTYNFSFNVKENKKAEAEILDLAFKDAKSQAEAIAKSAKLKLTKCAKVSFKPFEEFLSSPTRFEGIRDEMMSKACKADVAESIENIFMPEDVTASKDIYCIWIAE